MRPVAGIFLAALAVTTAGCQDLECGARTIEIDGKCVASPTSPNRECGPGTVLDTESGRCVSDLFDQGGGICGPNTIVDVNDAGVHICVGTGGGGSCNDPLPCPAPTAANSVSLCGRIYDLEDSTPLDDGVEANGEAWKTIEIRVLDPLAFIGNPTNAPIIARGVPDSCGRYVITNAERPPASIISVTTEDITDSSGTTPLFGDNLVQTGIADIVSSGQVVSGQRAWIFRRSTAQQWSTSAGLASDTFGKVGVYIPIFISSPTATGPFPAAPTTDVKIAIIEGVRTVKPLQDFYFGDSDPLVRRTVVPAREMTGANGTGIYIMQPSVATFSGLGNAPAATCWASNFAAAPVGAAFVQERTAEERFCP